MAANLPPEYYKLKEKCSEQKDERKQIKTLKEMLSVIPKHKDAQNEIAWIKRKISKLEEKIEKEKKKGGKKKGIRKKGAARVSLVGAVNTGKTKFLNELTGKDIEEKKAPYSIDEPKVGMINYSGVKVQMIRIPSLYENFSKKRGKMMGLIKNSDLLVMLYKDERSKKLVKKEMNKIDVKKILCEKGVENLKKKIWENLNILKVYTRRPSENTKGKAIGLKEEPTIEDLGKKIHKDFVKKFRYAKVIRETSKVKEKEVGLNYELENNDIVEFHLK